MSNIVLIGMMGCGKTSVGKAISLKYGLPFIDTDKIIEDREKMTISQIFEQYGETHFRALEAEAAQLASNCVNTIIATGGGIILNSQNMTLLKATGFVVYLQCNPKKLYERTVGNNQRPLLNATEERLSKIKELLIIREPLYMKHSNFILNADEATAKDLADIIWKKAKNEHSDN